LNFLAVAEYPRSKMLKGYLTQFLKGLHIILSPLRTSGVRSVGFLSWPENIERVCVVYRWGGL
jgi:hypothetical protein